MSPHPGHPSANSHIGSPSVSPRLGSTAALRACLAEAPSALTLCNTRLPTACCDAADLPGAGDGLCAADLHIADGRLRLAPPGAQPPAQASVDLAHRLVWPPTIDCHTHLDKAHTLPRRANADGTFHAALTAPSDPISPAAFEADLRRRVAFSLDCAEAHGTRAVRTHIDADPLHFETTWGVLREAAEARRGRLDLQLLPFIGPSAEPDDLDRMAQAARQAGGALSLFLPARGHHDCALDRALSACRRHGIGLDVHADETIDPEADGLAAVARAVLRTHFEGDVLVGHACALAAQPPDVVDRTLDLVAAAGIGVVALPLCNAALMDRRPRPGAPRLRGPAPLTEIAARGIPTALASDNVRDVWHAGGDMDLPALFAEAMRWMHLDHPVAAWPATVTATPARLIGRPDLGRLTTGGPADLIVFSARRWDELLARPAAPRVVLRAGRLDETPLPDFSDLDDLEGCAP